MTSISISTAANNSLTTCTLPSTLPIDVGVIFLSNDNPCISTIDSLMGYCSDTLKLLSLIPDQDKLDAQREDDGLYITTDDANALRFANQVGMLDAFDTTIQTLLYTFSDELCSECLDELIDHTLDHHTFDIEVNAEGQLELKLGACSAATKGKKVFDSLSSMPAELTAV